MIEWISVNEDLPTDHELVVAAHFYDWYCEPDCAICTFVRGEFIANESGLKASNYDGGAVIQLDMTVTHWMRLPLKK